jgi:hypothetical protein
MSEEKSVVDELNQIADKGGRTELFKTIAKEIEKDMYENLFNAFCETDPADRDSMICINVYKAVLEDFMGHVYGRCQNGEAARIQLKKLTSKLKSELEQLH